MDSCGAPTQIFLSHLITPAQSLSHLITPYPLGGKETIFNWQL